MLRTEDEDREAILARRKRLLASALSGVAMGALSLGAQACACLSPPARLDGSVRDASLLPCLQVDAGTDAGIEDAGAGFDAGDAAVANAGLDGAVDAASDAGLDGAADSDAGS